MFRKKPVWTGRAEIEAQERRFANRPSIMLKRALKRLADHALAPYRRLHGVLRAIIRLVFWSALAVGVFLVVKAFFIIALKVMLSLFILTMFGAVVVSATARLFGFTGRKAPRQTMAQQNEEYMQEMADQHQWEEENHWN